LMDKDRPDPEQMPEGLASTAHNRKRRGPQLVPRSRNFH
jgi:hypothetical protein